MAQLVVPMLIYPLVLSKLDAELLGQLLIPIALASFLGNLFNQNLDTYFSSRIFGKRLHKKHSIYFSIVVGYKLIFALLLLLVWIIISLMNGSWYWFFAIYTALSTILVPHFYIAVINRYGLLIYGFVLEKLTVLIFVIFYLDNSNFKDLNTVYFLSLIINLMVTYYLLHTSTGFPLTTYSQHFARLLKRYQKFLLDARFFVIGKSTQVHTDFFKFFIGTIFGPNVVVIVDFLEKVINSQRSVISMVNNHYQYREISFYTITKVLIRVMLISMFMFIFNIIFLERIASFINISLRLTNYEILMYSLILFATPIILLIGHNFSLRHISKTYVAKAQIFSNVATLSFLSSFYFFHFNQDIYFVIPVMAEMILALALLRVFFIK